MTVAVAALEAVFLFALPMGTVGVLGISAARRLWIQCQPVVRRLVAQEASRYLRTAVAVDAVTLSSSGIMARGVRVQDPVRPHTWLFEAESVRVPLDQGLVHRYSSQNESVLQEVAVRRAVLRLHRDRAGMWNILRLLRPGAAAPARVWVRHVAALRSVVEIQDEALFTHVMRPGTPLTMRFADCDGELAWTRPAQVAWRARGRGLIPRVRSLSVTGQYCSDSGFVLATVRVTDCAIPRWSRRFLPAGYDIASGLLTGTAVLMRTEEGPGLPAARHTVRWYHRTRAQVHDVRGTVPWMNGPVSASSGILELTNTGASVRLAMRTLGTEVPLEGRVTFGANPFYDMRAVLPTVRTSDLVYAFHVRNAELRRLSTTLPSLVRGVVRIYGPGDRLSLAAAGRLHLQGSLDPLLSVEKQAALEFRMEGPLDAPRYSLRADAGSVRIAGVPTPVTLWADGDLSHVQFRCRAPLARGTVTASGRVWRDRGSWHYDSTLHGRDLKADDLWTRWLTVSKRLDLTSPTSSLAVRGDVQMDLHVRGALGAGWPAAEALVQVFGPYIDNIEGDRAELSADYSNGSLTIHRALLERGTAFAAAHGTLRFDEQTGWLAVTSQGWPLETLASWGGAGLQEPLGGVLTAGSLRLEGPLVDPRVAGSLHFSGLRYGDWDADNAVVAIGGTAHALLVEALLQRPPALGMIWGTVRRLPAGNPWVVAEARVEGLDAEELAELAGTEAHVTGVFTGSAAMEGPVAAPTVSTWQLKSENLWVGDVPVGALSAQGSACISAEGAAVEVSDLEASIGTGRLTAAGVLSTAGDFSGQIQLRDVPLAEFSSYWSRHADVAGTLDAEARITGKVVRDEPLQLFGLVSGATRGLTVNGESFGDAWADVELQGRSLAGRPRADRLGAAGFGDGSGGMVVDRIEANFDTKEATAAIALNNASLDMVRRAVSRSPAIGVEPEGSGLSQLLAALEPVGGNVSVAANVHVTPDGWQVTSRCTSNNLSVADKIAGRFACSLQATGQALTVEDLTLQASDAVLYGSGSLVFGKSVQGRISAEGLDLSMLGQWLPSDHPLHGLRGTLDSASAEISGLPDTPEVAVVASARAVKYESPVRNDKAPTTVTLPALRLSGVLREGELRCDDLAVILGGTSRTSRPATRPLELHAAGSMPFSWQRPRPADSDRVQVTLRLPRQPLEALGDLVANGTLDVKGTLSAEARLAGTVGAWRRVASGEEVGAGEIAIEGDALLQAERIRTTAARATLKDVNLAATVRSDMLVLGPEEEGKPVAQVVLRGAGPGGSDVAAGDLHVRGSLPLVVPVSGAEGIMVTAQKLKLDESPLPGFATGRFVGELSTATGEPGLSVAVRGSVLQPTISGVATLRRTLVRLPASEPVGKRPPYAGVIDPSLDFSVRLGDGVAVTNSLLLASLYTNADQPLRITGSFSAPRLNGRLLISGGKLTFPTARFTIARNGRVDVRYPVQTGAVAGEEALEVSVDLTASAFVTARSVTGARRRYRITVDAKGPLYGFGAESMSAGQQRLRLAYHSDPPDLALSQGGVAQKVTALLGGQEAIQAVFSRGGAAGSILMGQAAEYIGGTLLSDVLAGTGLQEALGLQELGLDYSATGAFTLRLSRVLYGPLEASYWRRIAGGTETVGDAGAWELRLGLRLRDAFRLSYSVDSQRTNAFLLEGVYSF